MTGSCQCGGRRADAPGVVRVRLGILDADPGRRALAHLRVGSKAPWFEITDALPRFAGRPEEHADEPAAKTSAAEKGTTP